MAASNKKTNKTTTRTRIDPSSAEFTKLVRVAQKSGAESMSAVVNDLREQGYALSPKHADRIAELLGYTVAA